MNRYELNKTKGGNHYLLHRTQKIFVVTIPGDENTVILCSTVIQ